MAMPSFGDHRLLARMSRALALANIRYWTAVAPLVRDRLAHWGQRAQGIPDPRLRRLALANLREEGFNAQATATLATLAPRRCRASVAEAIVALQVLYDYLDSLVECPLADPLEDGRRLYRAFSDAISLQRKPAGPYYPPTDVAADGGYLDGLIQAVRQSLEHLPSWTAIEPVCAATAERCTEAQVRAHAVGCPDDAELERWSREQAVETDLEWREFLAGAVSSGLALHALIALAADPQASHEQALSLDALYLSLCSVTTLLDGLVDHRQDLLSTGRPGYLRYYPDRDTLTRALTGAIDLAASQARENPNAPHHLVTLVGIVAYYASAPTARDEFARPAIGHVTRRLAPAIVPVLAIMRIWRAAKRLNLKVASKTGHR